jgi:hypothetical protein
MYKPWFPCSKIRSLRFYSPNSLEKAWSHCPLSYHCSRRSLLISVPRPVLITPVAPFARCRCPPCARRWCSQSPTRCRCILRATTPPSSASPPCRCRGTCTACTWRRCVIRTRSRCVKTTRCRGSNVRARSWSVIRVCGPTACTGVPAGLVSGADIRRCLGTPGVSAAIRGRL